MLSNQISLQSFSVKIKDQNVETNNSDTAAVTIKPRRLGAVNWVGLKTLVQREVGRFLKVYSQTIIAPVVTTLLFYTVFMLAFGGVKREVGDIPFMQFLAPGLVMMAMAQNAFSNTSSSFIIAKIQGNIVDILMPPLSHIEILLGFLIGGVLRGLMVGFVAIVTISFFVHIPVHSVWQIVAFSIQGTMMMATMGIICGIWAERFDHIAAFTNFFVTPLTFLSGTFYSITVLPGIWYDLAHYNPFFFMIDGFRAGFIEQADGSLWFGLGLLTAVNIILVGMAYQMIRTGYKIKS